MAEHRIDIIIPCYNYAHFLDECLAAIAAQTRGDYQVLVMDNASTDDTPEVAARWMAQDSRIRYHRNDTNLGAVGNMKRGYELTAAEYVVILPADDLWGPTFLEATCNGLDAYPECSYAYTGWHTTHGGRDAPEQPMTWIPHDRSGVVEDMASLIIQNYIPLSFGVFRRSMCEKVGGAYPLFLPMLGDLYLWMRLAAVGPAYYVNENICRLRMHGANESFALHATGRSAFDHIHLLDLVFQSDQWPMSLRLLAKARQMQLLTGAKLTDIVNSLGSKEAIPIFKEYVDGARDDLIVVTAMAIRACSGRAAGLSDTLHDANAMLARMAAEKTGTQALNLLGQTPDSQSGAMNRDYESFLNARNYLETDHTLLQRVMRHWPQEPRIHLLVHAVAADYGLLADTLDSVAQQPYPLWTLTVLAPTPCPDPAIEDVANIEWRIAPTHRDVKAISDAAVAENGCDVVALLPPGSRLDPFCLWRIAHEFATNTSIGACYCDDDVSRHGDDRVEPRFKPDMLPDMLTATDYVGPLWMRRTAYAAAGGCSELPGAHFYDLTLRVLDQIGAPAIGHIPDPLLSLPVSPHVLISDGDAMAAVQAHLARREVSGRVRPGHLHATWRIEYQHSTTPSVDIIIPFRNHLEYLSPLLESLLDKTDYAEARITLVNNASDDPDMLAWLATQIATHPDRLRRMDIDGEWNICRLFNTAVSASEAEFVVLMHNDVQVLNGNWLSRLLNHGQRPEVAAVAPRLVTPGSQALDFTGSVVGLAPFIGSPDTGERTMLHPGYLGRQQTDVNCSVLDSAVLLLRRSHFNAIGGMDESQHLSYPTAELTLRLAAHGRLVWTPWSTVAHYDDDAPPREAIAIVEHEVEQASNELARLKQERQLITRCLPLIRHDPAWNPNLLLGHQDTRIDTGCAVGWRHLPMTDMPRIIADPVSGAGEYRVTGPLRAARRAGKALGAFFSYPDSRKRRIPTLADLVRLDGARSFILHHGFSNQHIQLLQQLQTYAPELLRVASMDDLATAVPEKSNLFDHWSRDTRSRVRNAIGLCDRLIVSTEPLAEFARHMIDDIRVVPNRLEWARWGHVASQRRVSTKPRIGWAGAMQHAGDLALIRDAIIETHQEADWVFFGMCPEDIKPYVREVHDWVNFDDYPEKLASLNLDLAVAPLEINAFNEAKSNLRLLDYGLLGWPVVCTDVEPYRSAPVTRVNNSTREWVDAIRAHLNDLDATAKAGDRLRDWVLADYILEHHVDDWLAQHLP
ncbi:glycosyltransferase [Denitromonas halophila]|uniref:Glycosyltransferase n=1 Tax=Denitromonas halophila TaxID=1629404 RepID=A0A557QZD3_9RHOO|nr:glycosyltransferase [Denitromonas halophila]TVO58272.1 glycosyltransferase [Denitromonas halophila]